MWVGNKMIHRFPLVGNYNCITCPSWECFFSSSMSVNQDKWHSEQQFWGRLSTYSKACTCCVEIDLTNVQRNFDIVTMSYHSHLTLNMGGLFILTLEKQFASIILRKTNPSKCPMHRAQGLRDGAFGWRWIKRALCALRIDNWEQTWDQGQTKTLVVSQWYTTTYLLRKGAKRPSKDWPKPPSHTAYDSV